MINITSLVRIFLIGTTFGLGAAIADTGPDVAPQTTLSLIGSSTAPLYGSTTFRVMAREFNGTWMAVHVDVITPTGDSHPFAYYGPTGADTQEWTLGSGVQGLSLDQLGTYTIVAKTADYSAGYERWGNTCTATVTVTTSVQGNTYYLSTSGNDSNNGSELSPWASLSKINSLQQGDTLLLRRGDEWNMYSTIGSDFTITSSGTSQRWITIGAYGNGARPVIRRQANGSPQGGVCFYVHSTSSNMVQYLQLSGLHFDNSFDGINVTNDSGSAARGYEITDCEFTYMNDYGHGVYLGAGSGDISDVGVNQCSFTQCWTGIHATASGSGWIRNLSSNACTTWQNGSNGLALFRTASAIVANWSIDETGRQGAHPGSAAIYIEYGNDIAVSGTTVDGIYHYGNQTDAAAVALECGPATTGDPGMMSYILIQECTFRNTQGPGVVWLGRYGPTYNIIQNNTLDNVNTLNGSWVTIGLPESVARAAFTSFNSTDYPPTGGAFINNTRINIPTLSDGSPVPRYCGIYWGSYGLVFSSTSYSAAGPSN